MTLIVGLQIKQIKSHWDQLDSTKTQFYLMTSYNFFFFFAVVPLPETKIHQKMIDTIKYN